LKPFQRGQMRNRPRNFQNPGVLPMADSATLQASRAFS
jgi:hypothetical protein